MPTLEKGTAPADGCLEALSGRCALYGRRSSFFQAAALPLKSDNAPVRLLRKRPLFARQPSKSLPQQGSALTLTAVIRLPR
ncbi:hypothetical protein T10_6076 [Trichinella papuae]|uniref:Uncharacterized protein n=1 Tax=Trichinella papuae TaxID=268474 RepID=A0A0V1MF94_9BILA|nr:hypothetical protein T10_6076 [Trichinella papuae]